MPFHSSLGVTFILAPANMTMELHFSVEDALYIATREKKQRAPVSEIYLHLSTCSQVNERQRYADTGIETQIQECGKVEERCIHSTLRHSHTRKHNETAHHRGDTRTERQHTGTGACQNRTLSQKIVNTVSPSDKHHKASPVTLLSIPSLNSHEKTLAHFIPITRPPHSLCHHFVTRFLLKNIAVCTLLANHTPKASMIRPVT